MMVTFLQKFNRYVLPGIAYVAIAYFSYLMILITWQYVPLRLDVAFLRLKQEAIQHAHYQWAFFAHVYTSIFVILLGIMQFSERFRLRYAGWHKNLGKAYILLVLLISSPSGFIMAWYANGGIYAQLSFGIQAILWFYFTYRAFVLIKKKEWRKHRNFMMRSYAMTLSAVSLRLFKWMIVSIFEWPPMDTYRLVAWLGWIVNLLIVEVYINKGRK